MKLLNPIIAGKSILYLLIISMFQTVHPHECDETHFRSDGLLVEWASFPEGSRPDNYFVNCYPNGIQAAQKATTIQHVYNSSVSLTNLEHQTYNISITSQRGSDTLGVRSFLTDPKTVSDITVTVTSTSVSFSWNNISSDFTVSIRMKNVTINVPKNQNFYKWDNLTPGNIYNFVFIIKRFYTGSINVTQNIDVQIKTGQCPEGWSAFESSCYKIVLDLKTWGEAEKYCESLYHRAHLVNVQAKEEQLYLSRFLHLKNEIILLWSGLSDQKVEGQLLWTDGTSYELNTSDTPLFSNLPKNETDCYILQQNATGTNYFYTAFFCDSKLPFLCEYDIPEADENFTYLVKNSTESEIVFQVDNVPDYSQLGYYTFIMYYSDSRYEHLKKVSPNSSHLTFQNLNSTQQYHFIFGIEDSKGSRRNLSPVITVQTRPLYPKNLTAVKISPSSVILNWEPPPHFSDQHLCGYKITVLDVKERTLRSLMESKNLTSSVITNLKSFHNYIISIQTVGNTGSESLSSTLSLVTEITPLQNISIQPDAVEDTLIINWDPPKDNSSVLIEVTDVVDHSRTISHLVNATNSFSIGSLVPGMTYKIALSAVIDGNMSEVITLQQTLRPKPVTLVVPLEQSTHAVVLFVQVADMGVYDGIFISSTNAPERNMSFVPASDGKYTIDQLVPGTQYEFHVYSKSKNKLSNPYKISTVRTCLASPSNVREGTVTDSSIQVIWDRAEGSFQQYEIICRNCSEAFMVQKVRWEEAMFTSLIPGTIYSFSVSTEKVLFRDSVAFTINIQTVPSLAGNIRYTTARESINVTWEVFGQFDGYVISLTSENTNRTETISECKRWHAFSGLLPGVDYEVSIITTCGLKKSLPAKLNIITVPEPPSALQILGLEEHTIYLSWEPPRGGYEKYQLTYRQATGTTAFKLTTLSNDAIVTNLAAGEEYVFEIVTIKGQHYSEPEQRTATTRPQGICGLVVKHRNTTSATLAWDSVSSSFTHYRILLNNLTLWKEFNVSDDQEEYTVTPLTPGEMYDLTIQRMKGGIMGHSTSIKVVAEPERPVGLSIFNISAQSFSIRWSKPPGRVDSYHVDLFPQEGFVAVRDLGGGEYQADVSSAVPGTSYTVTISSVSSSTYTSPYSKSVVTNETIPGPPENLAGESVGSAGILLSWSIPQNTNGKIVGYSVIYREVCPWIQSSYTIVATTPDSLEVLLTSLTPGTTYEIKVAAENSAGIGSYSVPFLFNTAESAPGKVVNLTAEALNSSAVNLTWFLPRQPHGKITSFKISVKHARTGAVVKDTSVRVEEILNGSLPECSDKSESSLWRTTSPSPTRGLSTTTTLSHTVPAGSFTAIWNEPITYIVGSLRPYTTYLFEVSAFNTESGYIDSTIVRTPESIPEDPPQNLIKGNITARSFSVTWDAPTIVTGKFSYRVELYSSVAGRILDNSTKDLRFTFTNLTPFTTYNAYISGETSAGVGPRANISVFTPAEVPSAVSDLREQEVEANFITVSWQRPSQPNGIITQYRVRAFVKETGVAIENTILTGKYQSIANVDYQSSTVVNEYTKSFQFGQAKEAMTGIYEGSADAFSTVQVMSPVVFYSPNSDTVSENVQYGINIEAQQLSHTVERLLPFTDYTISVSAFTTVGEGPPTEIVIRTSEQVPSSVNNISYQNISSTSVMVFWDPPLEPNGMITHYIVYAMDLHTKEAFQVTTSNTSALITGLKKYTDYKMRVAASNTAGESSLSEENDIFVRTLEDVPGSPPQNLVSTAVNATSISLEWSPPAEPNGIIVLYEIVYTNSTVIISQNTSSTSYTLTDLNPFTLYRISVLAYTRFGHGNQSTPVLSIKTSETAPSSPPYDLLFRNLSSTKVLLTWKPPIEANGIILFYKIIYWNSSQSITVITNTSEPLIVLSELKKHSQYKVTVAGYTVHGDGNQTSEVLQITTMEDAPDDPPQNLSYTALNSTSIQLSYSPPSSPNGVIKYYSITCLDASGRAVHVNSSGQSAILTDLKKFTEYFISISASTSVGPGPRSHSPLLVRTGEDVPDSAPQNITYRNVSSTEVIVSYFPPSIPNGVIVYYTVYITWMNGTVEMAKDTSSLSIRISGLRKYTSYILIVSASTVKGEGVKSEPFNVTTEEDAPSTPPRYLSIKQMSSALVTLSWQPPLEPNGIILFYTLYICDDLSNKTINVEETTVDLADLENSHEYSAYVTSNTRFGDGNIKSDILRFKTLEGVPSDPPSNFSYRNVTSHSVMIFWNPPIKPNGVIKYYSLYCQNSSGIDIRNLTSRDYNISVDGNSLSALIDGLEKFSHYQFWITASTVFGDGHQTSEVIDVSTEQDVPDAPPIIRECKNLTSTTVLLSWEPPERPNGIITSYYLQIYGPKGNHSLSTTQVSIILEDLEPFTQVFVFLAARTIKGRGPPLQLAFLTDEAEPSEPPYNMTFITASANSAWLQWNPSPKPNGIVHTYSLKVMENISQSIFYQNISGDRAEGNLTNLEPFTTYLASVSAFTKVGNGNKFSNTVIFTTQESAPDSVRNVHCTATSWQSVLVQWDPPSRANGIITNYIITFHSTGTRVPPTHNAYTFRDLLSNTTYSFTVQAANSAGIGIKKECNATTKSEEVPSMPRHVTFSSVESTSVTLQWSRPEQTNGYLKNYKITVELRTTDCYDWHFAECVETNQDFYSFGDNNVEKTINGLKTYRWYRFKISASTSAGYGAPSPWIDIQTLSGPAEGPPQNVKVVATSAQSLNISWSEPYIITGPTSYIINVSSVNDAEYNMEFVRWSNESRSIEVKGLKPFTKYSAVVIAFTGDLESALTEGKPSSPVIEATLEAVPSDSPKNITIQKIVNEVTKVQMTFNPPSEPNGNIQVFQALIYKEDDPTKVMIRNLSVIRKNEDSVTAIIEGLKGGNTYNISLYAINGAGAGPRIHVTVTTDVKEPPRPTKRPVVVYDSTGSIVATSTTITIEMPICYFSDVHGPIQRIQILVSEMGAQHDDITKWHEAYFQKPGPYFTNEGFPNPPCPTGTNRLSRKQEVYVIGANTTCMQQEFCNGPLKPRKQYIFKFRATNYKGQYTDSDYSEAVKTLGDGLSDRAVEIILSVTLCILSVILLGAAIFAFARIRQKQKEGGTYSPRDAEIIDTKFKLDQFITVADLELKDERLTRPVSKKAFLQHVEDLCANNNVKFQEEFSELPKFLEDLAVSDADLPWNRSKNRFTNIKPYNNNRVKLIADAGVPGSDYINASYVSGYICPNEFIATQGPLAGTVGDFWRMVWETRAKTIVMLTHCFEKGRIRCHQYWPEDNKPVTVFGDIVITKLNEDVQIDWTVRNLKIERHGDFMMVHQCNFTSWPEHGVPENTTALIHFTKMVRASRPHENTPTIIHCSAGVGRTGVFIGLDHLIQHINHHDFVDVYGLVAELRSERMCMVQNLAQYIFLHQCALDLLASKGSNQAIFFVNYSALQKMDSLDAMEGDVELEWEETTM